MRVFYIGLNHRTAPVEIRECLALAPTELDALLAELTRCGDAESPILETIVLSTCNRFEAYAVAHDCDLAAARVLTAIERARNLSQAELSHYLVREHDATAAAHLCAVASGLDSMVLGEAQILGQVAEAHDAAISDGCAGPVLSSLFRKAIECGKRARSETAIGKHATSVSHVAVELSKQIFGALADQPILVVGAGEMAELAARNLLDNGATSICVINRSQGRAERLAQQLGGTATAWEDLALALERANIVLCSTGAPQAIIGAEMVRKVMVRRRNRPLFLIDVAVPRNVAPEVGQLPNVYLYDIDDLQVVVERNLVQRQREIPPVQAIIEETTAEFMDWLNSLEVVPTIRDLRSMASAICDAETARTLRRLKNLDAREEQLVRALGKSIVNKLLHNPTIQLKKLAASGDGYQHASVLRGLFGLASRGRGDRHD